MKMNEVKERARALELKVGVGTKKVELIRTIQTKEGNSPCFQTGVVSCDQPHCCWRHICLDHEN